MKQLPYFFLWLGLVWEATAFAESAPAGIRLNTVGYLPDSPKKASVHTSAEEFAVVRLSDQDVVLKGRIETTIHNLDTNEDLSVVDFSALSVSGDYAVRIAGLPDSPTFKIAPDVYREPFTLVTRAMYLWRCGTAVDGEWNGRHYHHEICHTEDAWTDFVNGKHGKLASTGGWHDAGDYNKYVVNAGVTVGAMLRAWQDFGETIGKVPLKLPESGEALPDFLAEIKFEIDWLFTMQAADGSVYTKVSTEKFGGFILPEKEKTPRYFCPWGSPATADFVAVLAQAARTFQPYNRDYAERCLSAAKKSYAFLCAHPENHTPDQSHFRTGAYPTTDPDDRLWAVAELWETTGEPAVLRDLESRIGTMGTNFQEDFDWGDVRNLGFLTYVLSKRDGRNAELVLELQKNLLAVASTIVGKARAHGYARPLSTKYYWGGNGGVARQSLLLEAAYRLTHDRAYHDTTLDALNYLFGRNVDGRSYVTGLGSNPPMHPHDRRSAGDNVDRPWPGYLVGGPHPKADSWKDLEANFSLNEIAINWNGALIYALAAAVQDASPVK